MKRYHRNSSVWTLLVALLPACSDDDGVTITEVDSGSEEEASEAPVTDPRDAGEQLQVTQSTLDVSTTHGETQGPVFLESGAFEVDGSVDPNENGGSGHSLSTPPNASTTGQSSATTEPEDSLYALAAAINDGNTWVSYVVTSPSLKTHITTETATEVLGRALAVGPDDKGVTYVTSGTSITRYRLNDQDELEAEEPVISFAGVGVTADIGEYGGQFVFEGDDKSYYFDGANSQIVVWNPAEMSVGVPIPLDIVPVEAQGITISYSAAPVRNGDQVIAFVGLREGIVPVGPAAVVVLDTSNDTAQVATNSRCGYVRDGVLAADGWLYLATEGYASAYHRLNDEVSAPCLLRFDPKTAEFDADFHVELSSLVDGDSAGSLVVAKNGSAYLKVLDEELAQVRLTDNPRALASKPVWNWASVTLGKEPAAKLLDLSPTSGSVTPFTLGRHRYGLVNRGVQINGVNNVYSDVVELDEAPTEAVGSIDGLVFSITKLR